MVQQCNATVKHIRPIKSFSCLPLSLSSLINHMINERRERLLNAWPTVI